MPSCVSVAVLVTALLLILARFLCNVLFPVVISRNPLALLFLDPRTRYLPLLAVSLPVTIFCVILTLRRSLDVGVFYAVGRRFGSAGLDRMAAMSPLYGRILTALSARPVGIGFMVLVASHSRVMCVLCGSSRISPRHVGLGLLAGLIYDICLAILVARVFEAPLGALLLLLDRYPARITLGIVALGVSAAAVRSLVWKTRVRRKGGDRGENPGGEGTL